MSDDEALRRAAEEWVRRAENDLRVAVHTLALGADCPTEIVCFHAQQCAEKYVKAGLVSLGRDFPRSHDLANLCALLPTALRPGLTSEEAARLTDYAATSRYPGDYEEISLAEAKRAVALARRVRRDMRRHRAARQRKARGVRSSSRRLPLEDA